MGRPGFWDDQETAARTSAAHARAQRRLEMFRGLESDIAELGDLAELADEDEEIAAELDRSCARSRRGWPSSKRRACSAASTTPATRSSPSTPAPAAPTPRTGPRSSCGCTCAGPNGAASRSRWPRPRPGRRRA